MPTPHPEQTQIVAPRVNRLGASVCSRLRSFPLPLGPWKRVFARPKDLGRRVLSVGALLRCESGRVFADLSSVSLYVGVLLWLFVGCWFFF